MSLVMAKELSVAFGSRVLFDDASFTIGPKDRIGLVGPNGSGKSTLMRILAGVQTPDEGTVQYQRRARAGYLPQELQELPQGMVIDAVMASVPGRTSLEARLSDLQRALEESTDETEQLELAQELADLHTELEHFDDRYGRHRAERILRGLGFPAEWLNRDTSTLSGGWRMRAALAGLLLQDPDLLLLDEPTNHLDLPTLTWFDGFLRRTGKALVLISHDRAFLNRQVNRILALEVEGLRAYPGDFEAYKSQRALELEQLRAQAARVEARRAELQAFIDRFRAKATKARQAQSRMKMLERLEEVVVVKDRDTVRFRFPPVPTPGREVVSITGVRKAYGATRLYDDVNLSLRRGQRVAVVGVNGAGKTTLLKLVAGELAPDAGRIELGHNVVMGYYAQHHADTLDRNATILEEIQALVPDRPQSFARGVLGTFLFSGDDVDKRIGVLSGGERARVALAKLLVRPANLLLMDEPTNHLDLDSSEALIEALRHYEGTLLFVSHNRSFLNQLATDVWEVRDRRVTPFPGNLDDYLYKLSLEQASRDPEVAEAESGQPPVDARPLSDKERRRIEAEARQRLSRIAGPIKKEIARIEARIAELERATKEREAQLADPALYDDFARARPILDAHQADKAELEALYAQWEDAQTRLQQAESAV
ncbi:MAG: ABC-F family ATP-binding cassette domain-containing protein [Myxococcaceae bacterium]|nr:ABC-F family ATP-binding cassette domain-containing protein [Myxococcaceae bacterium]